MSETPRIALITGGSRGLGRNTALRLAESGIDSIITYRIERAAAEQTVEEIVGMGRRAAALQLDIGEVDGHRGFAADVAAALSEMWNRADFDCLVNNAGILINEPIAVTSEETFDRLMNVHFKGVFFLTQKLLPLMADGGTIVNVSSGLSRYSFPGYAAYGCMKSAIDAYTRYLATELGERGITANTVAPGAVLTDMNRDRFEANPESAEMISNMTALGRIGEPDDIGGVIAFLCSPDAGWMNGQRIELSGGFFL